MNEETRKELVSLRKRIIENEHKSLNDRQLEAALTIKGALLILAGAGSGKTTVLVERTAQILRWGEAYESEELYGEYSDEDIAAIKQAARGETALSDDLAEKMSVGRVYPWRILAITFTNKAAKELKERICAKVGERGNDIWASTFHACCTRILRRHAELLGFTPHFTIYDTDDQKRLIKDCMKSLGIDERMLAVKDVMYHISNAKDNMTGAEDFKTEAGSDALLGSVARVYGLYQKRLLEADAMDFDDIIFHTVTMFNKYPDVLEKYSQQFRYIMVDEYQDTNMIQYELVRLLATGHKNICVVGDDDQSIYKFRGATIRNILEFEDDYENTAVIRLEQNYRSTKTILSAANSVIGNNYERKSKSLWTENPQGDKITVYTASDDRDESDFIANDIKEKAAAGAKYSDFAVLYRMNNQSQGIERTFVHAGIPYRIIGGRRFYERREVRDMIAYLSVISNPSDSIRLKRILNIPKRGIGDKTISNIEEISSMIGQSMFDTMRQAEEFEVLAKSGKKLIGFCDMIEEFAAMQGTVPLSELYEKLLEKLDYETFVTKASDYTDAAADNVRELATSLAQYEEDAGEEASLQGFLEETALLSDIDGYEEGEDCAVMMTLHSAKGLEFENVYIPGMEENVFPGYQSTQSAEDMQEERRLAYVGITRAKKNLTLITAKSRMVFGHTNRNRPSRFITEIPDELKNEKRRVITPADVPEMNMPSQKSIRMADIAMSKTITSDAPAAAARSYSVGMRVKHRAFGEGMVISVRPMASDSLIEIAFDRVGTKKLMAKYANLTII